MTEPIIFVSRNKIREGKAEEFKNKYLASVPVTMDAKPGTIVQLAYQNEFNEVTIIRLFPSAEALDHQLQGAEDRSKVIYELIEPTGIEIYGSPSIVTVEKMKKIAGSGIPVSISQSYLGGFIR